MTEHVQANSRRQVAMELVLEKLSKMEKKYEQIQFAGRSTFNFFRDQFIESRNNPQRSSLQLHELIAKYKATNIGTISFWEYIQFSNDFISLVNDKNLITIYMDYAPPLQSVFSRIMYFYVGAVLNGLRLQSSQIDRTNELQAIQKNILAKNLILYRGGKGNLHNWERIYIPLFMSISSNFSVNIVELLSQELNLMITKKTNSESDQKIAAMLFVELVQLCQAICVQPILTLSPNIPRAKTSHMQSILSMCNRNCGKFYQTHGYLNVKRDYFEVLKNNRNADYYDVRNELLYLEMNSSVGGLKRYTTTLLTSPAQSIKECINHLLQLLFTIFSLLLSNYFAPTILILGGIAISIRTRLNRYLKEPMEIIPIRRNWIYFIFLFGSALAKRIIQNFSAVGKSLSELYLSSNTTNPSEKLGIVLTSTGVSLFFAELISRANFFFF